MTISSIELSGNKETMGTVYNFISSGCWAAAARAINQYPEEASEWIIRNTYNEQTNKEEECRVLPIHTACALNPPQNVVKSLLDAYPEAATFADNQGLYPLHYACGNFASEEVVELVLNAFPEAIKLADPNGMLPLHHMTLWGISSPKALDTILVQCDDEVYLTKDVDGSTPLDLAFVSEENDHVEYVIAQLESRYPSESMQSIDSEKANEIPEDIIVSNNSEDSKNSSLLDKRLISSQISLTDKSKMTDLENKVAEMEDICAKYKNEEKNSLVVTMHKEMRSLRTKLTIAEKENKMLNTYRTQNKSLETSLKNCKKELKEFKQKCKVFRNDQDILESFKAKNRSLESSIKSLNEELLRVNKKSEKLERKNDMMYKRVSRFTSLTRNMYTSMKTLLENDEAFKDINETLPSITQSKSNGTNHTNNSLPISRNESTNFETLMDDLLMDNDIIPQTDA